MTPLPKRLLGTTAEERWMNQLLRCVEERTPLRSVKQRLYTGPTGFRPIPTAEDVVESEAADSSFQGEHDPSKAYTATQTVCVRGGVSAGFYYALIDVPVGQSPAFPDVGIYWMCIVRGASGVWG